MGAFISSPLFTVRVEKDLSSLDCKYGLVHDRYWAGGHAIRLEAIASTD